MTFHPTDGSDWWVHLIIASVSAAVALRGWWMPALRRRLSALKPGGRAR